MVRIGSTEDLGAYIRRQRSDAGLSQAELARRAGVSVRWLVSLEQGKPTAAFNLVLRTLDALGAVLDARRDAHRGEDLDELIRLHSAQPDE